MYKFFLALLLLFGQSKVVEHASSAILMDSSGQILYAQNEYEHLHPASMTKMMGMLLIYEAINNQQIAWSDLVSVSAHAASMGGSQIYLEENEQMTLEELFTAICVSSANDAMVAVSEYISGSEALFVEKMNAKVSELGLKNTHFSNATGLDVENHYSCAYDMAMIAKKVLEVSNEQVTNFTSIYETYLREDTNPFWLVNTNKLIRTYEGMDGLKTGFTQTAGYCLTATAKRDNLRLIAVVMKEATKPQRNADIEALLNYGYANYTSSQIFSKNESIDSLTIANGKPKEIQLVIHEDVHMIHPKNTELEYTTEVIPIAFTLPITTEEPIAKLQISTKDQLIEKYLYSNIDVEPLNYIDVIVELFIKFLL